MNITPESEQNISRDDLRKDGAKIAIGSITEQLRTPLAILNGYWKLHIELGRPLNIEEITQAIGNLTEILDTYDRAAAEDNIVFAKFNERDVLSIHPHAKTDSP